MPRHKQYTIREKGIRLYTETDMSHGWLGDRDVDSGIL